VSEAEMESYMLLITNVNVAENLCTVQSIGLSNALYVYPVLEFGNTGRFGDGYVTRPGIVLCPRSVLCNNFILKFLQTFGTALSLLWGCVRKILCV
jgi:hypothetical protein